MGLLSGLARHPLAGSATAVSRRVARRQALRWLEHVDVAPDRVGALERLVRLHGQGLLQDQEFLAAEERMTNP
jgi:hypothetical protein